MRPPDRHEWLGHADGQLAALPVGRATTDAFHTVRGTPGPGLRRLYHGAIPASVLARRNAERVAAGLTPFDPERVYDLRGVPDDTIAVTADHRDLAGTVRDAFREHRTQWADPWADLDDRGWYRAAGAWHAVQAWPPWSPGSPRLTEPFDGL